MSVALRGRTTANLSASKLEPRKGREVRSRVLSALDRQCLLTLRLGDANVPYYMFVRTLVYEPMFVHRSRLWTFTLIDVVISVGM